MVLKFLDIGFLFLKHPDAVISSDHSFDKIRDGVTDELIVRI